MATFAPYLSKAAGIFEMARIPNCLMMGFAVIIGEFMSVGSGLTFYPVVVGFLVGFVLVAGSMAVNDIFDLDIDIINNPGRPIPSGRVSRAEAAVFAGTTITIGLVLASTLSMPNIIIASVAVVLMLYYNRFGKKTGLPGNAIVSTNLAIPFLFGGAIGGLNMTVLVFSLLAFLAGMGREIIKGIADVVGDSKRGVRTLAVTSGLSFASKTGAFFLVLAVFLSSVPMALGMVSWFYAPIVLVCDAGFLYSAYSMVRDPSSENAVRSKNHALLWMLLGLVAFVVGGL